MLEGNPVMLYFFFESNMCLSMIHTCDIRGCEKCSVIRNGVENHTYYISFSS